MRDEMHRIAREIEPAFPTHAMRLRSIARSLAPLPNLTRKQRKVFDFIVEFHRREHRTPVLREVAEHFGYSSLSTVNEHVGTLQMKGYLTRTHNKAGSIIICPEALSD
jgi:DNA-binding MarR family transcriptional regulator